MKLHRIAPALLLSASLLAVLAGFLSPYGYADQHREHPLAPPMIPRWVDGEGRWHLRPFVHPWVREDGEYREDRTRRHSVRFFVDGHLFGVDEGRIFLLGTDAYGRDVLSRLLHGGRISLGAALLATGVSLGLAVAFGSLSGYYAGRADGAVMWLSDLFLALPWVYLLLGIRAFLPLSLGAGETFFLIVALLGLAGWARPTRLVRSVVLSAKDQLYVAAARSFGAGDFHILSRHVIPQAFGLLAAQAAILIPAYVLAEVTLSFVGLGIAEPLPSWGSMLGSLQQYHVLVAAPWMLAPGVALVAVSLLFHSLLSGLRKEVSS